MRRIVLASASPQRKKILQAAGYSFIVQPSHVPEPDPARINYKRARKLVATLAQKKALHIAKKYHGQDYFILGADTLVVAQKKILGKPKDIRDAKKMLALISGSWQRVLTGICLLRARDLKMKTLCQSTSLRLKKMDAKTIARLARKNLDKSASYAVQDIRDQFLDTIVGDLDNVIGLPMRAVAKLCKEMDYGF